MNIGSYKELKFSIDFVKGFGLSLDPSHEEGRGLFYAGNSTIRLEFSIDIFDGTPVSTYIHSSGLKFGPNYFPSIYIRLDMEDTSYFEFNISGFLKISNSKDGLVYLSIKDKYAWVRGRNKTESLTPEALSLLKLSKAFFKATYEKKGSEAFALFKSIIAQADEY